jgi:DNA-binding transcriptional LysR family regulator
LGDDGHTASLFPGTKALGETERNVVLGSLLSRESVTYEIANKELTILNVQGFPLQRQWYVVHLKGARLSLAATALREFLLQSRAHLET